MASFIEACKCNGVRPAGIVGHRFTSRPNIVGRLLRDRRVARFIVAPAGYGKSTTAYEYASIMFGFKGTFWIDCTSPCFLRDLDAGTLAASLSRCDAAARLIVCEDVPCLDTQRAAAFSSLLDEMLARDAEVIVTCAPSADTFTQLQRDRMVLEASDLLLADEELGERAAGRYGDRDSGGMPDPLRAPCLQWADDGAKLLIGGVIGEELPQEVMLAMFALLALGKGGLDDIQAFLPESRAQEACSIIAAGYPFFGVDSRASSYAALELTVDQLAEAFGRRTAQFASACAHGDKDVLACRLADMLMERSRASRACELVRAFASKPAAAAWLVRSAERLLRDGEPYPLCVLHDAVRRGTSGMADQLWLCKAWALYAMGDMEAASTAAKRVLRAGSAADARKAQALCLLIAAGDVEAAQRGAQRLEPLLERAQCSDEGQDGAVLRPEAREMLRFLLTLQRRGALALPDWLALCARSDARSGMRDVLLICAAACLDALAQGWYEDSEEEQGRACLEVLGGVEQLCRFCCACLEESPADAGWFVVHAAQRAVDAAERGAVTSELALSEPAAAALRRMRMRLGEQRERYGASLRQAQAKKRAYNMTHPDPLRADAEGSAHSMPDPSVPTLTVNLFGGMEVRIGGKLLDPAKLSRMKVKTLLAVLVINRGREVPRQRLAEILWPESDFDAYRRNFYSLWSQLKRSLTVAESCPYLIRSQVGCSIDARLVASDVYGYEQICRSLLFGVDDSGDWERLYSSVSNEYAGQLMPCEGDNPTIVSLRDHYHAQMVDGLIATSARLIQVGEPRGALWFAREAARREPKREDVYISLMEAQMASDQRSAALGTYFECRKFLSEDLGIDPSAHLVSLYRSIIETEDVF